MDDMKAMESFFENFDRSVEKFEQELKDKYVKTYTDRKEKIIGEYNEIIKAYRENRSTLEAQMRERFSRLKYPGAPTLSVVNGAPESVFTHSLAKIQKANNEKVAKVLQFPCMSIKLNQGASKAVIIPAIFAALGNVSIGANAKRVSVSLDNGIQVRNASVGDKAKMIAKNTIGWTITGGLFFLIGNLMAKGKTDEGISKLKSKMAESLKTGWTLVGKMKIDREIVIDLVYNVNLGGDENTANFLT